MHFSMFHAAVAALTVAGFASGVPLSRRSEQGPVLSQVFPDPSLINVGGVWYAFGTSGNGVNIQIAQSSDFNSWTYDTGADALPTLPSWVNAQSSNVWAPDVVQVADGSFVLYFSASSSQDPSHHCVGTATSKNVKGPYTASEAPFACPLAQGGAIDPAGFQTNGQNYVVYKVDGNSIGHGGACGNTVSPIVSTPIMLQKVASDGVTAQGDAIEILDNDGAGDQGIVEAPSLAQGTGGGYFLFFSSGCFSGSQYTVSYATATSVTGPYTRKGALLQSGSDGLTSPGGADVFRDGTHMVFHAGTQSSRLLYTAEVILTNGQASI